MSAITTLEKKNVQMKIKKESSTTLTHIEVQGIS